QPGLGGGGEGAQRPRGPAYDGERGALGGKGGDVARVAVRLVEHRRRRPPKGTLTTEAVVMAPVIKVASTDAAPRPPAPRRGSRAAPRPYGDRMSRCSAGGDSTYHRPWNRGTRFSRNAATPSRWSSVWPQRRCVIASRSRSARKSPVAAWFTFSFM